MVSSSDDSNGSCHADIEVECKMEDVQPVDDVSFAPFLVASFDLEWRVRVDVR